MSSYLWQKTKTVGKIILASSMLYFGTGCTSTTLLKTYEKESPLVVHFLNVGNADSHLIETPNNKLILIDGGKERHGKRISKYIATLGYEKIDYVIASHPHYDHVGGLDVIMKKIEVDNVIDNGLKFKTKAYKEYIKYAKQQNLISISKDTTINVDPELEIRLMVAYDNNEGLNELTNDNSILVRLDYKDASFLFTGDLETEGERDLLNDDENLDVDVLKIGHHGNRTSTSQEFLDAISPKIVIIPTNKAKRTSSPHKVVLDRLINIETYRTDIDGDIIISTDGINYNITTKNSLIDKTNSMLIELKHKL